VAVGLIAALMAGCATEIEHTTQPNPDILPVAKLRDKMADSIGYVNIVVADAKVTASHVRGKRISFDARCTFLKSGTLRIQPNLPGVNRFDVIAHGNMQQSTVLGGEDQVDAIGGEVADALNWWLVDSQQIFRHSPYQVEESPGLVTFIVPYSPRATQRAAVDHTQHYLVRLSENATNRSIEMSHWDTIRNEGRLNTKSSAPSSFQYPMRIVIRTPDVTAQLDLSNVRINLPLPAGTFPDHIEGVPK
jgi:hypothetical protein